MNRECSVTSSKGVESAIPQSVIDDLVMNVVNEAYETNMVLNKNTFAKRFQMWTVGGKVADVSELIDTMLTNPEKVDCFLVIVALWEEKGNDNAHVTLQSEVLDNPKLMNDPQIVNLVNQPTSITKDNLLEMAWKNAKETVKDSGLEFYDEEDDPEGFWNT